MALYPDNRNSRDLIQRKYQIATDITDTVGEVFLGQTVQCARCHDHKFDPIAQKEYFQLQAFFANVAEVVDIPVKDIGPVEEEYRAAQAKYDEATKDLLAQQQALLEPVRAETIKYQKERYLVDSQQSLFKPEAEWTAFDRWINHRWNNVTGRGTGVYELDRYLRETAQLTLEETGKEDTEKLAQLAELRKIDDDLGKLNNLRPRDGSDTLHVMTELGHPDAPPTYVYFGGDHDRPLEEVEPGVPSRVRGRHRARTSSRCRRRRAAARRSPTGSRARATR